MYKKGTVFQSFPFLLSLPKLKVNKMDYRHKQNVQIIRFPKGYEEEKRIKCTPCSTCKQLALAHPTDSEPYKNDVKGVFVKRGTLADTVAFVMKDGDGNTIANLGTVATFPNDDLVFGFIYSWKDILNTHGEDCYSVTVEFTIAGVTGGYTLGHYTLKTYSIYNAKQTVKAHTYFNSFNEFENVDFTDSNFVDSVRFYGFFGNRQPKTEINNLVGVGKNVEKTTRENLNKYELRTDYLTVCITRQLIDFHFLNEDKILMSDHNPSNHSYLYFDTPVVVEGSPEVTYTDGHRKATIKVEFGDRVKKSKSFYNKK